MKVATYRFVREESGYLVKDFAMLGELLPESLPLCVSPHVPHIQQVGLVHLGWLQFST